MKALYREFRPRTFDDVKGQPHITDVLKNQVKNGTPSHAYVFSGPRGTGKTSTAKILAAALNCLEPENGNPCGVCQNCLALKNDTSVDIIEIDAASNNGVDNIRELREKVNLLPVDGKYKIYIIDEVHMLSTGAFNALLKTLEEPPSHVVFILATTELRKLPATVLSRCQRFDFHRLSEEEMVSCMEGVLKNIGKSGEPEALRTIARAADGGMRDALSLLDKCVGKGVTLENITDMLGLAGERVYDLADAMSRSDFQGALYELNSILSLGSEAASLVLELMQAFERMFKDSVSNADSPYLAIADRFSKDGLVRAIEVLSEAENKMRYSARPRIILEAALMRIMLPETDAPNHAEARLKKIESEMDSIRELIKQSRFPNGNLEEIFAGTGIEIID